MESAIRLVQTPFTSLGFQVVYLRSRFTLLLLWFVGGIFAICGALTYSKLVAASAMALGADFSKLFNLEIA